MSLREEFTNVILKGLESNYNLLEFRNYLDDFKKRGMSRETMIEELEALRVGVNTEREDTLLELLDFVVGFCNPKLSIFN